MGGTEDRGEKGIEILSVAQNRNTTPANSLVVRVLAVSTMCAGYIGSRYIVYIYIRIHIYVIRLIAFVK